MSRGLKWTLIGVAAAAAIVAALLLLGVFSSGGNDGGADGFYEEIGGVWTCDDYDDWYVSFYDEGDRKLFEEGTYSDEDYWLYTVKNSERLGAGEYRFILSYGTEEDSYFDPQSEDQTLIVRLEDGKLKVCYPLQDESYYATFSYSGDDYYAASPYYNGDISTEGPDAYDEPAVVPDDGTGGGEPDVTTSPTPEQNGGSDGGAVVPDVEQELGEVMINNVDGVKMYAGPSYDYASVGYMSDGDTAFATYEQNGWIYVKAQKSGDRGWIPESVIIYREN